MSDDQVVGDRSDRRPLLSQLSECLRGKGDTSRARFSEVTICSFFYECLTDM